MEVVGTISDIGCLGMLGYNYRIDEIRSAIGIVQLKKLDQHNERRRKVFQWYIKR
jgi:perosamine synthetase